MTLLADLFLADTYDKRNFSVSKGAESYFIDKRIKLKTSQKMVLDDKFLDRILSLYLLPRNEYIRLASQSFLPFKSFWFEFSHEHRDSYLRENKGIHLITGENDARRAGYLLYRKDEADMHNWEGLKVMEFIVDGKTEIICKGVHYEFSTEALLRQSLQLKTRIAQIVAGETGMLLDNFEMAGWGFSSERYAELEKEEERLYLISGVEKLINFGKLKIADIMPFTLTDVYSSILMTKSKRENIETMMEDCRGDLRFLVAVLASINNLSLKTADYIGSGTYKSRLKKLQYFNYSHITLDLDQEEIMSKLLSKQPDQEMISNELRRRRHVVRGHYRIHKSFPGINPCAKDKHVLEPIDVNHVQCQICQQIKTEIKDYEKGDASLGWSKGQYRGTASGS